MREVCREEEEADRATDVVTCESDFSFASSYWAGACPDLASSCLGCRLGIECCGISLRCRRCESQYRGDSRNVPVCDPCLEALIDENLSLNEMFERYAEAS